eukprot:6200655-Pleurochrysis_carterae.AAC.3
MGVHACAHVQVCTRAHAGARPPELICAAGTRFERAREPARMHARVGGRVRCARVRERAFEYARRFVRVSGTCAGCECVLGVPHWIVRLCTPGRTACKWAARSCTWTGRRKRACERWYDRVRGRGCVRACCCSNGASVRVDKHGIGGPELVKAVLSGGGVRRGVAALSPAKRFGVHLNRRQPSHCALIHRAFGRVSGVRGVGD